MEFKPLQSPPGTNIALTKRFLISRAFWSNRRQARRLRPCRLFKFIQMTARSPNENHRDGKQRRRPPPFYAQAPLCFFKEMTQFTWKSFSFGPIDSSRYALRQPRLFHRAASRQCRWLQFWYNKMQSPLLQGPLCICLQSYFCHIFSTSFVNNIFYSGCHHQPLLQNVLLLCVPISLAIKM